MPLLLQVQTFSDNDAFFVWTFIKRHPLWQTLLSFSWPVLTLAICLFPVYPHKAKLVVLYSCAGVLLLILCLLLCMFLMSQCILYHKKSKSSVQQVCLYTMSLVTYTMSLVAMNFINITSNHIKVHEGVTFMWYLVTLMKFGVSKPFIFNYMCYTRCPHIFCWQL